MEIAVRHHHVCIQPEHVHLASFMEHNKLSQVGLYLAKIEKLFKGQKVFML